MVSMIIDGVFDPLTSRVADSVKRSALFLVSQLEKSARRLNLPVLHVVMLDALSAAQSPLSLAELSEASLADEAEVASAVSALEDLGLVECGRSDDGRCYVRLTIAGRDAAWTVDPTRPLRMAIATLPDTLQADLFFGLFAALRQLQQAGDLPMQRHCVGCRHFSAAVHDDTDTPHHCEFADTPLGPHHLQQDCAAFSEDPHRAAASNLTRVTDAFVALQKKE